jgi:PAS domain S-box-containing protein
MTPEVDRPDAGRQITLDGVQLRVLFDATALPMVAVDDARRFIDGNNAACTVFGMRREELVTCTVDDFTPPELRQELERSWSRLHRMGSISGAFRFRFPDGRGLTFDYNAVANVGQGRHVGVVFPTRRFQRPPEDAQHAPVRLSAREREILQRVARGQDGPEIARDLVVSPATVRTHIGNAIRKLGARSRAHAIAVAMRHGLLED